MTPAHGRVAPLLHRVVRLVRGALPAITVATIVPLALFYGLTAAVSMKAGIIGSLTWAYLVLARQLIGSRRVSGLLMITALTLTVRCVTWAVHQSAFTFFAVPVGETVGMGALFIVTLVLGRPLLVSLAHDFVPAIGERLSHVNYRRLVRHLSCLWGAVYIGSAATSAVLLTTQNIHWFLLLHQASGWVWTGSGLAVSFLYGRRHAGELLAVATAARHHVTPAVAAA
ncbi:MAG: hypothetical protein J2P57_10975 [Acidimicrobiaceae bacterium]|nr:hypothetical protein [Acidimicrobiaceae bacterium]